MNIHTNVNLDNQIITTVHIGIDIDNAIDRSYIYIHIHILIGQIYVVGSYAVPYIGSINKY